MEADDLVWASVGSNGSGVWKQTIWTGVSVTFNANEAADKLSLMYRGLVTCVEYMADCCRIG